MISSSPIDQLQADAAHQPDRPFALLNRARPTRPQQGRFRFPDSSSASPADPPATLSRPSLRCGDAWDPLGSRAGPPKVGSDSWDRHNLGQREVRAWLPLLHAQHQHRP